jgi:aspartate racemase
MTESFYRKRLVAHGIDLLPPEMAFVEMLDKIIYDELMVGKVTREAQRQMKTIITNMAQDGARAIVLACTELDLVVDVDANVLPVFDSTRIHCEAAANWILDQEGVH